MSDPGSIKTAIHGGGADSVVAAVLAAVDSVAEGADPAAEAVSAVAADILAAEAQAVDGNLLLLSDSIFRD